MASKRYLSRREVLKGALAMGGAAVAAAYVPAGVEPMTAHAAPAPSVVKRQELVIRFYTDETDPTTQEVFQKIGDAFTAKNPGVKIQMEYGGFDARQILIPAGVAAKQPPTISKLAEGEAMQFIAKGLLADVSSVIADTGGESAWAPTSLNAGKYKGGQYTVASVGQQYRSLWVRTDLLDKAGLQPPTTWDEWKNVAAKMTGNGAYGVSIAGGANLWTQLTYVGFLWNTGETMFDKDFNVILGGPGALAALEFYKEMVKYAPPDYASYSWGETIDAFVTGLCATQQYAGRTLKRVYDNNPSILSGTHGVPMPKGPLGSEVGFIAWDPYVVFSEQAGVPAENIAAAKEYLKFLLTGDLALDWYGAVPGHQIPPYIALQKNPALWTKHSLFQSHKKEIEWQFYTDNALDDIMEAGAVITKEKTTVGNVNPYYAPVPTELPLAKMVQKVIVENEDPKVALQWGVAELTRVVEDYKKSLQTS
jgi:ABC-type glycerol-3-phosphate transport system substrate-binding protein